MKFSRSDILLAVLAAANGQFYTPVQLQKALFLVADNLPSIFKGKCFEFVPHNYGPFDSGIYSEAEDLREKGLAVIERSPYGRWKIYSSSRDGITRGNEILEAMPTDRRDYILKISEWVRGLSFSELVRSIYDAYPEMKANSIFQG
jgi:hypothetical protein